MAALIVNPLRSSASTPPSEPPMGLMIQVSTLAPSVTPATLKSWLDSIRRDHRDPSRPGYINSVVLQDVADRNGVLLTSYLDVIAPYLPGGSTPAFDHAYIGTVDLPWTGSGSEYIDGIESAAFRNQNAAVSASVARAFQKRYPATAADWYITYEANLAGFWDPAIESSYVTYINQLAAALSAVAPGRSFLWSPAFWTPYRAEPSWALPALKANLTDLFARISSPLALDVQDFVGQSRGASTDVDAASWMAYVRAVAPKLRSLQVNVEQFTQSAAGVMSAGSASEVDARENYYAAQKLSLGPSWEIRFWHQRLYGG